MPPLRFAALLLSALLLCGCSKPQFTYTFSDTSQYSVSLKTPAEEAAFAQKLADWSAQAGYIPATSKDFSTFLNLKDPYASDPTQLRMARVLAIDPTHPKTGVLLTYQDFPGSSSTKLIRLYTFREGSIPDVERQEREIKQLRSNLDTAFPELR